MKEFSPYNIYGTSLSFHYAKTYLQHTSKSRAFKLYFTMFSR